MPICEVQEMCATRLKEATRTSHEAAEAVMMPILRAATTPQRYAALLQTMYGFYQPMETALAPFAKELPSAADLSRGLLLRHDLAVLGHEPTGAAAMLPRLASRLDALGALYVLEGASLGGLVIAKMLRAHDGLPTDAFRFFTGKGGDTGPHWRRFVQTLNETVTTPQQIDLVCAAASATFDAHAAWMKTAY